MFIVCNVFYLIFVKIFQYLNPFLIFMSLYKISKSLELMRYNFFYIFQYIIIKDGTRNFLINFILANKLIDLRKTIPLPLCVVKRQYTWDCQSRVKKWGGVEWRRLFSIKTKISRYNISDVSINNEYSYYNNNATKF